MNEREQLLEEIEIGIMVDISFKNIVTSDMIADFILLREKSKSAVISVSNIANCLVNTASGCKNINAHHGKIQGASLIHKGCVMCWAEAIHALLNKGIG